jgi:glycosyltransferase involved in cell wall biosynthesis
MKKVLIWNSFELKERSGGPPTYLFNLYNGVKETKDKNCEIFFLSDLIKTTTEGLSNSFFKKLLNKLYFPILINNIRLIKYVKSLNNNPDYIGSLNLNDFDIIHFHLSIDVFRNRKILNGYNGKVLLSSHSPEPFWKEAIIDIYKLSLNSVLNFTKKSLEYKDIWGFNFVDFIVFPCEEAMEPYLKWDRFSKDIVPLDKFLYITSGIKNVSFLKNKNKIRNEVNIPSDAIVFTYIGRHSEIKGYDLLKKVGKHIMNSHDNVYFLIAGIEYPLRGIDHPRWIEIGWTTDPHSYVNASDIFILPNKETYFDLVLLEVLSLGLPIILSNTGGNKHFKKYSTNNISFFEKEDIPSFIDAVNSSINSHKSNSLSRNFNKKIFKENYSIIPFTLNYYKLYKNIC